jgi:hypothetical protein
VEEECNEEQHSRKLRSTFKIAKEENITVFVSPHYYFKHDQNWQIEGSLEALMHKIMFDRTVYYQCRFENSGADWLENNTKKHRRNDVIVTSPQNIWS